MISILNPPPVPLVLLTSKGRSSTWAQQTLRPRMANILHTNPLPNPASSGWQ